MDIKTFTAILQEGANEQVAFLPALPNSAELATQLCGLANTRAGGWLIVGVDSDTNEVQGVKNPAAASDNLLQAARQCKPAVAFAPPGIQTIEIEGKKLVVGEIPGNSGTLHQVGGVFWARRGTQTVILELDEIERFLYDSGSISFELQAAPGATLADLDRAAIDAYLNERPAYRRDPHREKWLVNLGCAVADGTSQLRPTNAGVLLFATHPQQFVAQAEVTCAYFQDALGLSRFADRRVIEGTIPQQIDAAENWLRQYIAVASEMIGFKRYDRPAYPLDALREAVANAVLHRDYSLRGEAVRIFVYPDRIEIHNPGTLMPGLSLEDLRQGNSRSKPRNPTLMSILRDMPGSYVERLGTGIPFMINRMRQAGGTAPEFGTPGEFVAIFRKITPPGSEPQNLNLKSSNLDSQPEELEAGLPPEERYARAVAYLQNHASLTSQIYRELTGTSVRTATRDLDHLATQGVLRAVGNKRGRRYLL